MITQEIISFVTVLFTAVCVASAVSVLYAFGLRLLARAQERQSQSSATCTSSGATIALGMRHAPRHIFTRLAAAMCFAACIVIVLFSLWLMIPLFH